MPYKDHNKKLEYDRKWKSDHREHNNRIEAIRRKDFPEYKKAQHRKKRYGLTKEEYARILHSQGGVCKICREPESMTINGKVVNLAVDHCHDTNIIRGLLCTKCNGVLGFARDKVIILESAIRYLQENGK